MFKDILKLPFAEAVERLKTLNVVVLEKPPTQTTLGHLPSRAPFKLCAPMTSAQLRRAFSENNVGINNMLYRSMKHGRCSRRRPTAKEYLHPGTRFVYQLHPDATLGVFQSANSIMAKLGFPTGSSATGRADALVSAGFAEKNERNDYRLI